MAGEARHVQRAAQQATAATDSWSPTHEPTCNGRPPPCAGGSDAAAGTEGHVAPGKSLSRSGWVGAAHHASCRCRGALQLYQANGAASERSAPRCKATSCHYVDVTQYWPPAGWVAQAAQVHRLGSVAVPQAMVGAAALPARQGSHGSMRTNTHLCSQGHAPLMLSMHPQAISCRPYPPRFIPRPASLSWQPPAAKLALCPRAGLPPFSISPGAATCLRWPSMSTVCLHLTQHGRWA